MASSFGNWIDDPSWDFVQLGGVFIPGVCTVSRFADGVDVDVQKKRKKEKARLRDNGIAPCAFVIKSELTAADWEQWCKILPAIKPRRPGAVRTPLGIVHPLPNLHGVESVYVKEIEYDEPSARRGMTITIKVGEWFEEQKDTPPQNKTPKAAHPGYRRPDYFGDPKELADTLYRNQHGGLAPDDTGNVLENSFSPEGNDRFGS